jgi:hypothetical protein
MTATTARRPRIPMDLADKLDALRAEVGISFEEYVRDVLESHVERYEREVNPHDTKAVRLHEFYDNGGAYCWIDQIPDGGWGERKDPDVIAGLAVEDEGYEAVGVHLTRTTARALRDTMTQLLDESEPRAAKVRAIK